jgi:hypothetical protein
MTGQRLFMQLAHLALAVGLTLGLVVPVGGARADAAPETAQDFQVDTKDSTHSLKVGEKGRLVLLLQPAEKWHVHPQAPLKVRVEAAAGLKLEKAELGRKDAVEQTAGALRFEVPFVGSAAGKQEARAHFSLFLCSDTVCVRQTRSVTVPVDVK